MSPSLPATILVTFDNVALTKYFAAIGFTIILYDALLTLPDEIRLVWPERWNLVKALFYVNRVLSFFFIALNTYHLSGLAPEFSNSFCQVLIMTTGYGAIFAFGIANWMLLARAIALWGGTRRIVWCMTIFYLITYISTITVATVASVGSLVGNIFYSPPAHVCAVTFRPNTFGAIWVPSILFEMVLFGMLFIKLFSHARQSAGTASKLIQVLHRDGIVYFVVIFCLRIFNLIAWSALPLSLVFIGIMWVLTPSNFARRLTLLPTSILWSFTTLLLTRLHLNLKSLGTEPRSEEDLDRPVQMRHVNAEIAFRHPTPDPLPRDSAASPINPVVIMAKKGKKKRQWGRRDSDMESNFQKETNIFPGGTAIDPNEMDAYSVHLAVTRPGTAVAV